MNRDGGPSVFRAMTSVISAMISASVSPSSARHLCATIMSACVPSRFPPRPVMPETGSTPQAARILSRNVRPSLGGCEISGSRIPSPPSSFLLGVGVGMGASFTYRSGICPDDASALSGLLFFKDLPCQRVSAAFRFFSDFPLTKSRSRVSLFCVQTPFSIVQKAAMMPRRARHFLGDTPTISAKRLSSSGRLHVGERHAIMRRRR